LPGNRENKVHIFHSSSNVINTVKSRWKRLVGHIAHIEDIKKAYRISVGKRERQIPLGIDAGGRNVLKKYIAGFMCPSLGTTSFSRRLSNKVR
jgi:hypothetical protein